MIAPPCNHGKPAEEGKRGKTVEHDPMRARKIGDAANPGPSFVPGYMMKSEAEEAREAAKKKAAARKAESEALKEQARVHEPAADPSASLTCQHCDAFVEDGRHRFCTAFGAGLRKTRALQDGPSCIAARKARRL